MWIYVRDRQSGEVWSAAGQPAPHPKASRDVTFHPHKASYRHDYRGILIATDVVVAPEDDVEIRLVRLTNRSARRRRLRLASYSEVILTSQEQDRRHPAFNKLFIESEYLPEVNGLLFGRRRRAPDEEPVYLVHLMVAQGRRNAAAGHEADRANFLRRGRTVHSPAALDEGDRCLTGRALYCDRPIKTT